MKSHETAVQSGAPLFTKFATCELWFATWEHFLLSHQNKHHTCNTVISMWEPWECERDSNVSATCGKQTFVKYDAAPFAIFVHAVLAKLLLWNQPLIRQKVLLSLSVNEFPLMSVFFCVSISFCVCQIVLFGWTFLPVETFNTGGIFYQYQTQFIWRAVWRTVWLNIVSVSRISTNLAASGCFWISPGVPPPDWWSCLFLITSEIKYRARNVEIGTKDFAAAGAGAIPESGQ